MVTPGVSGPKDDPGADRPYGLNGFRYWVTSGPKVPLERRCHCGWLRGRTHYGTVGKISKRAKAGVQVKSAPSPKGRPSHGRYRQITAMSVYWNKRKAAEAREGK